MYLVVIAWLYVTLMMAIAEATNAEGSILGAIVTFVVYGLAPMALVVYLMATPARKRKIKAREADELAAWQAQQAQQAAAEAGIASTTPPDVVPVPTPLSGLASGAPDAGGHAPGAAEAPGIAPVRKET